MNNLLSIFSIAILILFNAIFVSAEYAMLAVSKIRMADLAQKGDSTAQIIFNTLDNPTKQNRYISTVQIWISIISLTLGMIGENIFANWLLILFAHFRFANTLAHTIATILAVILLTIVHVVLGEMIPKTLTLQNAESYLRILIHPMNFLEKIFDPIVYLLNKSATKITEKLGFGKNENKRDHLTYDEIEYIVEESSDKGIIENEDEILIENIFDLKERTAEMVMTSRIKIIGLLETASFVEIKKAISLGRTRYPIYTDTIDEIIGFIHIKDIGRNKELVKEKGLIPKIIRPIEYIPQSMTISQLLILFREKRLQIAVVIDEYGGTAGIITLEDLIEEVVGEILDEFDIDEVIPFDQINETQIRVRGDLPLDEFEQLHNIKLQANYTFTLGGYLMEKTGRILIQGETITIDNYKFTIDSMKNLSIRTVIIENIK